MILLDNGRDRVAAGSIMDGTVQEVLRGEKADVVYVDPPWGPGLLKMFETFNRRAGGAQAAADFDAFTDRLMQVCRAAAKGVVFIEYGIAYGEYVQERARKAGLRALGRARTVYKGGKGVLPQDLHVFTVGGDTLPGGYLEGLEGQPAGKWAYAAVEPFAVPGGVLFDPCCGLGMSARIAKRHGMRFYGVELNQSRAERTAKVVGKGQYEVSGVDSEL